VRSFLYATFYAHVFGLTSWMQVALKDEMPAIIQD